jgi:hypothetical protein
MSDDDKVLDFVDGRDDPVVAQRLRDAYESVPPASDSQLARCQRYVADGIRDSLRTRVSVRRWWWGGVAAAALLAFATLKPVRLDDASRQSVDSATAMSGMPKGSTTIVNGGTAIRFDLELPAAAARVALVGDFNGWDSDATPMVRRGSGGQWSAQVPLTPGVHNYAFVIDGQRWMVDPLAPQVPDEGFGPSNAVVVVGSR